MKHTMRSHSRHLVDCELKVQLQLADDHHDDVTNKPKAVVGRKTYIFKEG